MIFISYESVILGILTVLDLKLILVPLLIKQCDLLLGTWPPWAELSGFVKYNIGPGL